MIFSENAENCSMFPGAREISFLVPDEEHGRKRLCAVVHGDRDAPHGAIVMLHGFQDNANSYFHLAPRLARQGFFCICIGAFSNERRKIRRFL